MTSGIVLVILIIVVILPIYLYCCIKASEKRKQALAQLEDPEANRNTELQQSGANSMRASIQVNNGAAN